MIARVKDDMLLTSVIRLLFDLAFELHSHLFLFHATIHPLWFVVLVEVTCDAECSAGFTYRVIFVAFFATDPARPAAIGGPHRIRLGRTVKEVYILYI